MVRLDRRAPVLAGAAGPESNTESPGVVLTERYPLVMFNLRAGRGPGFLAHARSTLGLDLPHALGSSGDAATGEALWLGPSEWLLVAAPPTRWSDNMAIDDATLTDVSHARVAVRIAGARTRDVLTKGCMLDLHPRSFLPRMCAQTSIAKINVIIHRISDTDDFNLYAPRSYAGSFWQWLIDAAAEYGYRIPSR